MTALQASTSYALSFSISSIAPPPLPSPHRHLIFAQVGPSEKSVEIMRKFYEQYARRSGTYFCVDKGVTSLVIKGLAEHNDTLGAPLYPCSFVASYSRRKPYATMANNKGSWEDPVDGSYDSEFEDEYEEEDEESEDELDYKSDWETNGNGSKVVVTSADTLSVKKYEDSLFRDVEHMLSPEEIAILEQNEAPNLEILSTKKWKPFQTFALAAQIKFMDELLEKGYDIEQVDKDGVTALHLAVIGKREAVISHLLRKGANPEARDKDGATPLHYAVQVGAMQTVKLLMKSKVDVNIADNEGWTPLHVAMQTRNRYIAKILLVNGADINRKNADGYTALDLTMCYGKEFKTYDLAKMLKQVAGSRSF